MASKPKKQWIKEFLAEGYSELEAELQAVKKVNLEQERRLRNRLKKQEEKVSAAVIELLQAERPDLYAELREQALEKIGAKSSSAGGSAAGGGDSAPSGDGGNGASDSGNYERNF